MLTNSKEPFLIMTFDWIFELCLQEKVEANYKVEAENREAEAKS